MSQPERSSLHITKSPSLFVGRRRELAALTESLKDAISGQGRLVMLAGEPGIGKTRTAQELASRAKDQGATVLWGWCYEEEGAPPFWPWVQAVRSYVHQCDPGQLQTEMGPTAAGIAEIVPDIHDKLPGLEPPSALEPEQARFRLFDSITRFLKNVSQNQPLMLVLDDLHWADRSSLLLLEFVAGEISSSRLLLAGTYRDVEVSRQHPLSQTLGSLMRESATGGFRRVRLRGLARQEVYDLARRSAGMPLSDDVLHEVHGRTEDNPLFVGELARSFSQEGTGSRQERPGTIPEGIRDAIGRRLSRISDPCNEALTVAAVAGRQFSFDLLKAMSADLSEEQLLELLDEALRAGLLEEVPGGASGFHFQHALIQETLLSELTAVRQVRLHARIAQAMEGFYGDDAQDHAADLARHFLQAQPVLGGEKPAHYSLMAGRQALAAYALEEALFHFEKDITAKDLPLSGTKPAPDEQAADLLFGLAQAQSKTLIHARIREAFATWSRAFEYYAGAGIVEKAVASAGFQVAAPTYPIPGAAEMLTRALAMVPEDSHDAGRLLSRLGGVLGSGGGDYQAGQRALQQAITIAQREGDRVLEVEALNQAATVAGNHMLWQEAIGYGLKAIQLAADDDNPFAAWLSLFWTALGCIRTGNLAEARRHTSDIRDLAENGRANRRLASSSWTVVTQLACLEGDWQAGRESNDRGLELTPLNPLHLRQRTLLEHQTGNPAQGDIYLDRLLEAGSRPGPEQSMASAITAALIPAVARITGVPGDLEAAERAATAFHLADDVAPFFSTYVKAGRALLSIGNGDSSEAQKHYAGFQWLRRTMIETVVSVDRLLGLLSQTMGNPEQSAVHFEDALAFCRKAGYRPELAWTCCDYADLLLAVWTHGPSTSSARPGRGGPEKAAGLLEESLAIATELGMRPLVERVRERMERVQAQPDAAPAYPDGLS